MWYRDMTAIQLEANPAFVRHLAETITNFHMPGEAVAPQFEAEVPRWLPQLEADLERMVRDIVRLLYQTVGDTKQAGRLLMGVAAERNIRIGPFDPAHVDIALRRLGGPGYGLVGEALLVKVGLGGLFEDRSARPSLPGRLRGLARDWVAEHMEVDLGLETA